jgi:hypothetical protein
MKNATIFSRSGCLVLFPIFFFLVSPLFAANGNLQGTGEDNSPYIIEDTADWNRFASNINDGIDASSFYTLSDNFDNSSSPVTTMCGTSEDYSFKGTFDGNGKTLTVNFSVFSDNAAPFRYAKDATIQNLTVKGNITTSSKYAGGFIGSAYGRVKIENCISSVIINSSVVGDGTHGGLVGLANTGSNLFFTNCLFNGKLLGSNTHSNSGFLGYNGGDFSTFVDCLFAPAEVTMKSVTSATFNRNGHNSFDNCYFKQKYGEVQGQDASSLSEAELLALLGGNWEIKEGLLKPLQGQDVLYFANVNGLKEIYSATDGFPLDHNYELSFYGKSLTKNTDYEITIKDEEGNELSSLDKNGRYYLAFKGTGSYKGEKILPFYYFIGEGTEASPYLISDAADWNNFAKLVNEEFGYRFEGCWFALDNDIDFLDGSIAFTMVGKGDHGNEKFDATDSVNYTLFAGIFDGRNHSISGLGDVNCYGLFSNTSSNAVVKNLYLKNCIIRGRNRTGGIVGINRGKISNCHVTEDVYVFSTDFLSSGGFSGNGYWSHGGIAGMNAGGTIEGCSSAATVWAIHMGIKQFGGIVGYNSGSVNHCFYYGSKVHASNGGEGAIIGEEDNGEHNECLHTYDALGAVNNSNDVEASFAYILSMGMDNISMNYSNASAIDYGLVTAAYKTLRVGNKIYAPVNTELTITFDYKDLPFDEEKLVYEFISQCGSKPLSRNKDGYSFTMPESNVVLYAGYDWEGDGSEEYPYKISNIYQLEYLSVKVNSMKNTYEDKIFILENDIDASASRNFTPIGGMFNDEIHNFCGTFDGQNHTVSNLSINYPKYSALFGRLGSKGNVKNLLVKNCTFTGDFAVGSVAGFNEGSIEGCIVDHTVSVFSESSASSCFGGIAGYNKGTIENSKSSAKVSAFTSAGGITGYNKGGNIQNCLYLETVTDSVSAGNSYAGYIAGHNQAGEGELNQNYYIGTKLYALGSAKGGNDSDGAKRLYKISTNLVENLGFEGSPQGWIINSELYSAYGEKVKINLGSFTLEENKELVIGTISCDSFTDGICSFTMPAFDVEILAIEKNATETESIIKSINASEDPYTKNTFYASFYSSKNSYKVSDNVKVYYVISKGYNLALKEVGDGIINAGEAVIIKSSKESVTLTVCEKSKAYKNNILKGTDSQITLLEGYYIFGFSTKGGVGFYKASSSQKLDANKAYIPVEAE